MQYEQAIQAYEQAPATGEWQAAAQALFEIRCKPRKVKARPTIFPTPWSLPKKRATMAMINKGAYPPPLAVVRYDDGFVARVSFWSQTGKPLDWNRAARIANGRYRFVKGTRAPSILHMSEENSGQEFTPPMPNNFGVQLVFKPYKRSGTIPSPGPRCECARCKANPHYES